MASLCRPIITRFVDANGNRVRKGTPGAIRKGERSDTFWDNYRVGKGRPVARVALCDDRETAESMLADLVKRARRELSGDVDPFEASRKKPLTELIAEFEKHLEAKNRSRQHVYKIGSYVRRIVDACGWKMLADLSGEDLANYWHDRRQTAVVTQVSLTQAAEHRGRCRQSPRVTVESNSSAGQTTWPSSRRSRGRRQPRWPRRELSRQTLAPWLYLRKHRSRFAAKPPLTRTLGIWLYQWLYPLQRNSRFLNVNHVHPRVSSRHPPANEKPSFPARK